MTNRERVIKSINFEKSDYLPYSITLTSQSREKVVAKYGEEFIDTFDNHVYTVDLKRPMAEVKPGYVKDEYGVIWNRTGADRDIGMPDSYLISDRDDFENYKMPVVDDAYKAYIRSRCEELMASGDKFKVAGIGFSMYERLWTLMGIEDTLCNMIVEPELVHDILNEVCNINLQIIDIALEYDVDAIYFGDDWGQQKGLIMGPKLWREIIKPYVSKMYDRVKKGGKYIIQHSCGDIREIMDDLYEMGLNVYQTYQPEIYGLDYAENVMRGKIAIWGGISTQHDLPVKSPEEIKAITREMIARFGENGGIILAPTHDIPQDVPPENIKAMLEVFLEQKK